MQPGAGGPARRPMPLAIPYGEPSAFQHITYSRGFVSASNPAAPYPCHPLREIEHVATANPFVNPLNPLLSPTRNRTHCNKEKGCLTHAGTIAIPTLPSPAANRRIPDPDDLHPPLPRDPQENNAHSKRNASNPAEPGSSPPQPEDNPRRPPTSQTSPTHLRSAHIKGRPQTNSHNQRPTLLLSPMGDQKTATHPPALCLPLPRQLAIPYEGSKDTATHVAVAGVWN